MKTVTIEEMIKIPIDEDDLLDIPIFKSMDKTIAVEMEIQDEDIQSRALRLIWTGFPEEAEMEFARMSQSKKWERDFQFDLMMGFWLAIHCGEINLTKRLMEYDVYLRQLVTTALQKQPEKPFGFVPPTMKKELTKDF